MWTAVQAYTGPAVDVRQRFVDSHGLALLIVNLGIGLEYMKVTKH
jgi:hypothetical protein